MAKTRPMLLRSRSNPRPPSLETVWEAVREHKRAHHAHKHDDYDKAASFNNLEAAASPANQGAHDSHLQLRGNLFVRLPVWSFLKPIVRFSWQPRFAVLLLEECAPPRVMLFHDDKLLALQEEIRLLPPLELHCTADEEGPSGSTCFPFTLSSAGGAPIELAVASEQLRVHWIYLLGESMSPVLWRNSSPCLATPSSNQLQLEGPLQVLQRRVADTYRMGKVLESGHDYMVIEGLHLRTSTSHALKLINKGSASELRKSFAAKLNAGGDANINDDPFGTDLEELSRYLGEVYEGPQHVCLVMEWGTHRLDSQHRLGVLVLEALRLLHELLPLGTKYIDDGLMLRAADTRKLISRLLTLDWHLQANLFLH